jgi:hypothetical protein
MHLILRKIKLIIFTLVKDKYVKGKLKIIF